VYLSHPLTALSALSLPHTILHDIFGYAAFRGHQEAAIQHVIDGGDALVLMPTGSGKSLCFQIPAIARQQLGKGVAVVVSPLIALMHDQVGALHEAGVEAAFLNSTLTGPEAGEVEQKLLRGEITLLYAAPERVTNPRFLALMDSLYERGQLSLFAIDEAHCVSQWGHDFRPEYRGLTVLHERFPNTPRIALTATADALTRSDIVERLQLQSAEQFVSSFDRPNIRYKIVEKNDPRKQLLRFIDTEHTGDAGIVYCQSRKRVEEVADMLCEHGVRALPYHAGLDRAVRQANQDAFLRSDGTLGEAVVMVATIAFGMGIDKPDVRFVAHLDMPKNIEGYYQETGRAGRDGEPANAWMCYGLQDVVNQRRMIDESPANETYKQVMRGKLDALLALSEAMDCRRGRLLSYFDEDIGGGGISSADRPPLGARAPLGGSEVHAVTSVGARYRCNNCDNCLSPAAVWDATEAARKAISCIFRVQQASGISFGAGHLIDILRGKSTDKVVQFNHTSLSTFGIGADVGEQQWRSVFRQLIALGMINVNAEAFNTLQLTAAAKEFLRSDQKLEVREATSERATSSTRRASSEKSIKDKINKEKATADMNLGARERFTALKAWRAEVAKEHNLPAYVIFHDATLIAIATLAPQSLADLSGISGMGAKKLEAYGEEVLRLVRELN
jgi:ATP-dependent DNA helicase RecQ